MIAWAYQSSYLSENQISETQKALENIGARYTEFGLIPFSDEIRFSQCRETLEDVDCPVIALGSTKLVKLWLRGKLPRNWHVFYDPERFSFQAQVQELGSFLLNYDAEYHRLDTKITFPQDRFIRPINDLKLFNGQVLPARVPLMKHLETTQTFDSEIYEADPLFLAASVKDIRLEYRCFVVDGFVADVCLYKHNGQLIDHKIELDWSVLPELAYLATRFLPTKAFVVDIAETKNGELKIIEYNCFNCSGFYHCNRETVFRAIEQMECDYGTD